MNQAGAYNSTAYGQASNDAITSALAKYFFEAQTVSQKDQALALEKLTPIIQLLGLDKGSVQNGKAAGGGEAFSAAGNQFAANLGSGAGAIVNRIFAPTNNGTWTKPPGTGIND